MDQLLNGDNASEVSWDITDAFGGGQIPGLISCLDNPVYAIFNNTTGDLLLDPNLDNDTGADFSLLCNLDAALDDFDALKDPGWSNTVLTLYTIVILLGTVGNSLVVLTVVKTKQLWTATNMFITALAIADVLVCILDLPVSVYYTITENWVFGRELCHIIPSLQATVVFTSTLTLTFIAIDRYLLIVCPLKGHLSVAQALLIVLLIVSVSVTVASPISVYSKYMVLNDPILGLHRNYCTQDWPSFTHRLAYSIITFCFLCFIPLIIIAGLYYFIFDTVRNRMVNTKNNRKTKTTKMLVAVVVVFAVSWTPYHIFTILSEVNYDLVKGRYFKLVDSLLLVIAMSSSCINPFLYGWLNDNYRNAFMDLVRRSSGRRNPQRRDESEATTKRTVVLTLSHQRSIKDINGNGQVEENGRVMPVIHEEVPMKAINKSAKTNSISGSESNSPEPSPHSPISNAMDAPLLPCSASSTG